jgi:CheY-like chemotaxis protein
MARIVIADDSPEWRSILAIAMKTIAGVTVATAESGEQALEMLRDEPADVLLTDVRMGGMSGLELLERLREGGRWPRRGAVVVSGESDPELPARSKALGASEFLQKPFPPSEIRRRVLSLLDRE